MGLKENRTERKSWTVNSIKRALILTGVAATLAAAYLFVTYTDWQPVADLRTAYIETAMSTMTHQYLARIFPKGVIDEAMAGVDEQFDDNKIDASVALDEARTLTAAVRMHPDKNENKNKMTWDEFREMFPYVDIESVKSAGIGQEGLEMIDIEGQDCNIQTIHGDKVYALNVPEKIMIVEVKTATYAGKLAVAGNYNNAMLAANNRTERGSTVTELCDENQAILGVNASGFHDPNGRGKGQHPIGIVLSDNELSGERQYGRYQIAGFDADGNFLMGTKLDLDSLTDAMQFYPIVVLDGKNIVTGSFGMGIQPRTIIGQDMNKNVMFLVIDGRQVGHSLGTDISTCADILIKYGCYAAMNMDGGSSSSMTYKSRMITRTSSPMTTGRYLPDAWVVKYANPET